MMNMRVVIVLFVANYAAFARGYQQHAPVPLRASPARRFVVMKGSERGDGGRGGRADMATMRRRALAGMASTTAAAATAAVGVFWMPRRTVSLQLS